MSRRLPFRIVLGLSLLGSSLAAAQAPEPDPAATAPAATSSDTPASQGVAAVPQAPAASSPRSRQLAGFQLLAKVGFGARTAPVFDLKIEPYAATFGLESGYTFRNGLRLGAYLDYGLGRSVQQTYHPRRQDEFQLTVDAWSLNAGLSVGYDLWLRFLILRYSLGLGVTWLNTDLSDVPRSSPLRLAAGESSKAGFHLRPGLAVMWPFELLECGVGFDYLVQTEERIPAGFLGKLLMGMRL